MTTLNVLGYFFHGLTFFGLTLTVIFLRYRSRRITLARKIAWLGGFALCESMIAWNDLLAPLVEQATLLPAILRTALLACGYAYLLAFGVQTFMPRDTSQGRLLRLLLGLQGLWSAPYALALLLRPAEIATITLIGERLARYFLALPGGLLTGFGLRHQSYQTLHSDWRGRIRPYLRWVEGAAATFGLLNFILVPAGEFFPFTLINALPFPTSLLWATVGFFWLLGLAFSLTTVQREVEQWIENVEHIQALSADRERIGRELHDGIIQSIYASGLMLESVKHYIDTKPEKAKGQLGRIMDSLNHTIQDIRRYIFDLRSDMPDNELEPGIRQLLRDFQINTLLQTDFEVMGTPPKALGVEKRRHLFQITREALTNTARHAHAQSVTITLDYQPEALDLTISDDGVGMEKLMLGKGYGLRNIRERARLLDGKFKIDSAPGEGVTLHLTVPY